MHQIGGMGVCLSYSAAGLLAQTGQHSYCCDGTPCAALQECNRAPFAMVRAMELGCSGMGRRSHCAAHQPLAHDDGIKRQP